MKILEDNSYIKVTCPKCKSILGVYAEDIHYNDMSHHGSAQWTICKACGGSIDISYKDIPSAWHHIIFGDEF